MHSHVDPVTAQQDARPLGDVFPAPVAAALQTETYQPLGWFRLLLACLVLMTHFSQNIGSPTIRDAVFPLCIAMIGVSCFFTLSGFIIADAMQSFYVARPFSFLINRLLRIGPPLLGALLMASLIYYVLLVCNALKLFHGMQQADQISFGVTNILRNLAGLLPLPKGTLPPNVDVVPVLWTLRIELIFYAAMFGAALVASVMARWRLCRYQTAMRRLLLAMAVCCLLGLACRVAGKAPDLVSYFAWFALGVALFYAHAGSRAAWCCVAVFLIGCGWQFATVQIAGRAAYQFNPLLAGHPVSSLVPLIILAGCLAIIGIMPLLRVRRFRAADRTLGRLTYPLYLNHITAGVLVLSVAEPGLGAMVAAIGLAIVFSLIMDRVIEPASAQLRTRLRGAALR